MPTQNKNQNDPYEIILPEFNPNIFSASKRIGSNPHGILLEIGVSEDEVIADFGCGVGFFVMEAADIVGEKGSIYAVDIDQKMLDSLKVKAIESGMKNIYGVRADLEEPGATGLKNESCDIVLMINLLYLIKNKAAVMEEAYRILKNNGKMVIMEWSDKKSTTMLEKNEHVSLKELKDLAQKIGFQFSRNFEAGLAHEVAIFSKK